MIMKQLLYILLLLPVIGNAQFGKKISELPKVDALTSADLVPVVQNGKNYSATVSKFANASVPDTVTGTHLFTGVVQLDSVQLTGNSSVLRPVSVSKDSLTGALGRGCASDCYWLLNGNGGTTAGTNFIGTTDSKSLYFKTKNTTAIVIDTNQNVGIGITTSGYGLYVNKNFISTNTNNDFTLSISESNFAALINSTSSSYQAAISFDTISKKMIFANNAAGFSETMVIDGNENVGIGESNPTAKLHVGGNFRLVDGTQGAGKVLTSDAYGNASWGATAFTSADSVTIYALTPTAGTVYFCTNCTGNGFTGHAVYYAASLWRRWD